MNLAGKVADMCEEFPCHSSAIYNTDILTWEETGTFLTHKKTPSKL